MNKGCLDEVKKLMTVFSMYSVLSSCASRSVLQDNPITPAINLYNRNFISAAPTYLGNIICGTPPYLLVTLLDAVFSPLDPSETFYNVENAFVMAPAMICGALLGTSFVPLSFICPENPWYFDWKTEHRPWSCRPGLLHK